MSSFSWMTRDELNTAIAATRQELSEIRAQIGPYTPQHENPPRLLAGLLQKQTDLEAELKTLKGELATRPNADPALAAPPQGTSCFQFT